MKKIETLLVALLVLSLTACEDWLDVSATSELDREELFKTENGFGEALTGIYAGMCDASLYGRELTFDISDMLAGYYFPTAFSHVAWPKYAYASPTAYSYDVEYCNGYIEDFWTGIYYQIANCNSILESIDDHKDVFSEDNYNLIKGEALGLRAFLHFDLLRMFSEAYSLGKDKESIPYVTTLSALVTPRYIQEDALNAMLRDLEEAKELLTNDPMRLGTTPDACLASLPSGYMMESDGIEMWHNRRFRFNYYAVVATMARIYLWKGDKSNALLAAKEIITDQQDKFPWVQINNLTAQYDRSCATEHIFALNVTDLEELMDGYIWDGESGMTQEKEVSLTQDQRAAIYESNSADVRYVYWWEGYGNNWILSKFYQDKGERYFRERLPLIRLSEMYYIAAECAETPSEAVAYLEEVRRHRGLESFPLNPSLSGDALETEIRKEYQKELCGEGQMWFYYKRKSYMAFSQYMLDVSYFTFDIPDIEVANAGRE